VVLEGAAEALSPWLAAGASMMEARGVFMDHGDHIRKRLLLEPRGYPCQNANFILPSRVPGAAFGFVIAEQNKIYPLMSGHNCICVATALLEGGLIPMPVGGGTLSFGLEAPAGLILITAECSADGKAERYGKITFGGVCRELRDACRLRTFCVTTSQRFCST